MPASGDGLNDPLMLGGGSLDDCGLSRGRVLAHWELLDVIDVGLAGARDSKLAEGTGGASHGSLRQLW